MYAYRPIFFSDNRFETVLSKSGHEVCHRPTIIIIIEGGQNFCLIAPHNVCLLLEPHEVPDRLKREILQLTDVQLEADAAQLAAEGTFTGPVRLLLRTQRIVRRPERQRTNFRRLQGFRKGGGGCLWNPLGALEEPFGGPHEVCMGDYSVTFYIDRGGAGPGILEGGGVSRGGLYEFYGAGGGGGAAGILQRGGG